MICDGNCYVRQDHHLKNGNLCAFKFIWEVRKPVSVVYQKLKMWQNSRAGVANEGIDDDPNDLFMQNNVIASLISLMVMNRNSKLLWLIIEVLGVGILDQRIFQDWGICR